MGRPSAGRVPGRLRHQGPGPAKPLPAGWPRRGPGRAPGGARGNGAVPVQPRAAPLEGPGDGLPAAGSRPRGTGHGAAPGEARALLDGQREPGRGGGAPGAPRVRAERGARLHAGPRAGLGFRDRRLPARELPPGRGRSLHPHPVPAGARAGRARSRDRLEPRPVGRPGQPARGRSPHRPAHPALVLHLQHGPPHPVFRRSPPRGAHEHRGRAGSAGDGPGDASHGPDRPQPGRPPGEDDRRRQRHQVLGQRQRDALRRASGLRRQPGHSAPLTVHDPASLRRPCRLRRDAPPRERRGRLPRGAAPLAGGLGAHPPAEPDPRHGGGPGRQRGSALAPPAPPRPPAERGQHEPREPRHKDARQLAHCARRQGALDHRDQGGRHDRGHGGRRRQLPERPRGRGGVRADRAIGSFGAGEPAAIEEIRRILLQHLGTVGPAAAR